MLVRLQSPSDMDVLPRVKDLRRVSSELPLAPLSFTPSLCTQNSYPSTLLTRIKSHCFVNPIIQSFRLFDPYLSLVYIYQNKSHQRSCRNLGVHLLAESFNSRIELTSLKRQISSSKNYMSISQAWLAGVIIIPFSPDIDTPETKQNRIEKKG